MLNYLAVLSNQLLYLKTDKHWYCENEKHDGVWYHPIKCKLCNFVEELEKLHEDAAQQYLRIEERVFRKKFSQIIDLQNKILIWKPELEKLLSKEYQYKNSYHGKYCGVNDVYGPLYLKYLDMMTQLKVFNFFNEKNNYERFTYP